MDNNWERVDRELNGREPIFLSTDKISIPDDAWNDPYSLFSLIFDEEIILLVCTETNRYCEQYSKSQAKPPQRLKQWSDVEPDEIRAFLGVMLLLGLNHRSALEDHWSNNEYLRSVVADVIPKYRFQLIWGFLHLHNNEEGSSADKVREYIKLINKKWRAIYSPKQCLTVDETIVPTKNRSIFVQYEPSKPRRYGVKGWSLAESRTGYLLKFKLYQYKQRTGGQLTFNVVKSLLQGFENCNHTIYFDKYFTNTKVCEYLSKNQFSYVGMTQAKRVGLKESRLKKKLQQNECEFFETDENIFVHYRDKRQITLVSNIKTTEMIKVEVYSKRDRKYIDIDKPKLLVDYSINMRGVDKANQLSAYYYFENKQRKWWRPVFIKLIYISISNAFIIYTQKGGMLTHKEFIIEITKKLLSLHRWTMSGQSVSFNELKSIILKKGKRTRCKCCYRQGITKFTYFICKLCEKHICLKCVNSHLANTANHSD